MAAAGHNMHNYQEVYDHFSFDVPEYYNFGFDQIDHLAAKDRNRLAMIWVDQEGREKTFTFRHMMNLSNSAANMLLKYGIKKGDRVIIMLTRVPEWWIFALACIKLGAVFCPCPTMLTGKDLKYRINAAKIRMIITDNENAPKVEEICTECPSLRSRLVIDADLPGWISYREEQEYPAPVSRRLVTMSGMERTRSKDPLVIYFTSGTTGEPKMVVHNHALPLGHVTTGKFWLDLRENDLHFTLADTGWAKSSWGKFFGPWMQGACILVYDIRGRFKATELLPILEKYEVTATSFTECSRDDIAYVLDTYASPYVCFESHSYDLHHAGYSGIGHGGVIYDLSEDELVDDLQHAADILGTRGAFAYPYGDVSDVSAAAIDRVGIFCAFTTEYDWVYAGSDHTRLPRVRVSGGNSLEYYQDSVW